MTPTDRFGDPSLLDLPRPTRDAIAKRIREGLAQGSTAEEIAAQIRKEHDRAAKEPDHG